MEGTGWVSVEGLLMAAKRGFLSPSTLIRLLQSDGDESDETELLRYLATSAQRHLPAFAQTIRPTIPRSSGNGVSSTEDTPSVSIPVDSLVPFEWDGAPMHSSTSHEDAETTMINAYMSRIRHNLLRMQPQDDGADDVDETGDDETSQREEREREQSRPQINVSLSSFDDKLRSLCRSLPAGSERSAALCMWIEVYLPIVLRRMRDYPKGESFLSQWLSQALAGQRWGNSSEVLSGHVLSAILTMASMHLLRSPEAKGPLVRLHEQMESFCEGNSTRVLCQELHLFTEQEVPLAAELLKLLPFSPSLSDSLDSLLSTPTVRQQLEVIRTIVASGQDLPENVTILKLPAGRSYADQCLSGRAPETFPLKPEANVCPKCHIKLHLGKVHEIDQNRFGTCDHCNRFLIASF